MHVRLTAAYLLISISAALAQAPLAGDSARLAAAREKGIAFLRSTQGDDGTWSGRDSTGVSGLAAYSLLVSGVPADDSHVAKTLQLLVSLQQPDGRICAANSRIPGYETAIALMTLCAANQPEKYREPIAKAEKFVRGLQLVDIAESDTNYGGTGYGPGGGRADLSNTVFFIEALEAAGASGTDPAIQKAKAFVLRCQAGTENLKQIPDSSAADEGGFAYTPIGSGGGSGPGGGDSRVVLYGSMSYAGLKSMLYAGLTPDDPRVASTTKWIQRHYTLDQNPGMGANGLYYYYQLFAKALKQWGVEEIEDAQGVRHAWRRDLAEKLMSLQQPNGSWVNTSRQWQEGDPHLVTAYSLIALSHCERK